MSAGLTMDASALIAFERNDRAMVVIDASVVLCAREHGHGVLTSDVDDLERLDASLHYVRV